MKERPIEVVVAQGEADATFMVAPTLADAGYPRVESLAWNGLFAPADTPEAVVNDLLKDAAVKDTLDAQGLTAVGRSAVDFKRVLDAEAKRWGPIIAKIGVKLD